MRLAHLSDSHLTSGPLRAGPADGLARAVGRAQMLDPAPDCIVITGDLVENGLAEEYADLDAILSRCPIPVHIAAGNHDDSEVLVAAFAGSRYLNGGASSRYLVDYPDARLIMVDSRIPGSPSGRLGAEQLEWIDAALAERDQVPAFLALHHPPVPVGIGFLDGMRLEDGPQLGQVLERHRHVARVLAGHIHRPVSVPFAGTLVTIAPSTYRQAALRLHDSREPGYLMEPTGFLLHLGNGDGFVTHTVPVSHAGAPIAYA